MSETRPAPPPPAATIPARAPLPPPATVPVFVAVPTPVAPPRRTPGRRAAQAIAGLILAGLGFVLLLTAPLLGLAYFGLLIVIALLRTLLR